MSDSRLRRLWRAVVGLPGLIASAHLDAYQDVRRPADPARLAELDAALRQTGDGPWLPVPVSQGGKWGWTRREGWHWWPRGFGRAVFVSGQEVEIVPLEQFGRVPPASLANARFTFAEPQLIDARPQPPEPFRWLEGLIVRGLPAEGAVSLVTEEP